MAGLEDNRDWLLMGRRGSGALELLAGLWRQNRDRSERSSFDYDDQLNSSKLCSLMLFSINRLINRYTFLELHLQRPSMGSSSSSDGLPCSLDEYCSLLGHYDRKPRRGSCPVNNSLFESGNYKIIVHHLF